MQNSAIESRTQLRLNVEIEEQKQKLADLKITKEQERAKSGIYLLHNLRVSNEDYSRKRLFLQALRFPPPIKLTATI
jgi:hypothetical protein